ncbi:hypothetical protein OM076_40115 [Solirubrobacter ginsenosidimutans]|uniref:Uncharacterized protein n=1 Tax=Solirubrobacter ginsenosidimutans TaxID=490573 RepID=A0A9X3N7Z5_9ACTN|nr:hypothetical protein [Solirubrobacter ginsenosidimutans]MDA0166538.1 hypothetical protein [Solirubrobacter ginsenosidimutans]
MRFFSERIGRRSVAPGALAVCLFVAACGGSGVSKNDYVKSLNDAVASLQKSTASLGPDAVGGAGAVARLESGSKAMDVAAENFGKITPPDDAKHAHGQIVDGLHKLADTFDDAATAARSKDNDKLLKVLQGLDESTGARELQAATEELSSKGYKVQ